MSDAIEWRDPPPPKMGPRNQWPDRLQPLMERPGEWAMIYRFGSRGTAYTTRARLRGTASCRPPGQWEFTVRGGELFARYLGPES